MGCVTRPCKAPDISTSGSFFSFGREGTETGALWGRGGSVRISESERRPVNDHGTLDPSMCQLPIFVWQCRGLYFVCASLSRSFDPMFGETRVMQY